MLILLFVLLVSVALGKRRPTQRNLLLQLLLRTELEGLTFSCLMLINSVVP